MNRQSLYLTSVLLLSTFIGCESDTPVPTYPERMVRVRDMSVSSYPESAGVEVSVVNGGSANAGMMVAEGGSEAGTFPIAGTEEDIFAGTASGGSQGGSDSGGGINAGEIPAGTEDSTELNCLELLECIGGCGNEAMCFDRCLAQGSSEGLVALNELIDCDVRSACNSELNCVLERCGPELTRCDMGSDAPIGGSEVGGAEMGGSEMGGADMGGSQPPPSGPLSCSELIDCVGACPDEDADCPDLCLDAATDSATLALNELIFCRQLNSCSNATCIETFCTEELEACALDVSVNPPPSANECWIDFECPIERPYCVNERCVECVYQYDCAFGDECQQGVCMEVISSCTPDRYEPNDSIGEATSAELTNAIMSEEELMLCGTDIDVYTISICGSGTVTARVTFDSDAVDIDLELSLSGAFEPEAISAGYTGIEELSHTNLAAVEQTLYLNVYSYQPVSRASYQLDLNFECP